MLLLLLLILAVLLGIATSHWFVAAMLCTAAESPGVAITSQMTRAHVSRLLLQPSLLRSSSRSHSLVMQSRLRVKTGQPIMAEQVDSRGNHRSFS